MRTRHLTSLLITFNPFSPLLAHKIPRIILSQLGPSAYRVGGPQITKTVLPQSSKLPARLTLTFKNGTILNFVEGEVEDEAARKEVQDGKAIDLSRWGLKDVEVEVERIGRGLARAEELA